MAIAGDTKETFIACKNREAAPGGNEFNACVILRQPVDHVVADIAIPEWCPLPFVTYGKMRHIERIIIHHTAGGIHETMESIRELHVNGRGWSDIGYHYVIDRTGGLNLARPNWRVGAHCRGYNSTSIGIAVMGNFEENEFEHVTELGNLLREMKRRFPDAVIRKHNDYGATLCPGKHLVKWLTDFEKG